MRRVSEYMMATKTAPSVQFRSTGGVERLRRPWEECRESNVDVAGIVAGQDEGAQSMGRELTGVFIIYTRSIEANKSS